MGLSQSARQVGRIALRQWRTGQTRADEILARLLGSSHLSARDRAFTTELFYGILRNLSLLDFWIDTLRAEHLDPDARDLLRLGIYQLFLLDTPEHAAVYETVELTNRRSRPLVNAVLRSALRGKEQLLNEVKTETLSVRTSHPQFLIDRWTKNFGAKNTTALCEWNNRPAPIYARINLLKISAENFLSAHSDSERLLHHQNFARLTALPSDALAQGHCYVQDPSTVAACKLFDPQPGEKVLDACAAPGGKTGYIAELMKNHGTIMACDRNETRLRTLQSNLKRLGVKITRLAQHDWTNGEPFPNAAAISPFDRILVDTPCSNTGVMRRRVDLRWRLIPKDFSRMREEQLRILRATIPLLKTKGVLVYSTCSIEPEENEEVIKTITREFPFLKIVEEVSLLPFRDRFDGAFAAKLMRAA
jgi:16S rRNA (cytosine967-C5)-methyltransferase